MVLPYEQDVSRSFPEGMANAARAKKAYADLLQRTAPTLARLKAQAAKLPHLVLPGRTDDIEVFTPIAARLRARFDEIVVLATGGSSLGGQSLLALKQGVRGKGQPVLRFCDNLDPASMDALLREIDPWRTAFLVISKSGTTAESLVQLLVCFDFVRKAVGPAHTAEHFVAICEPGKSALNTFAERHGIPTLEHDPELGGRYSVLSVVGMLPAMIAGLDIGAVRAGAKSVLDQTLNAKDPSQSSPAVGAALALALQQESGAGTCVMMPYCDRLNFLALWYRQLWAESLGKDGKGLTPIRALGPVDQHSQLQLYLEGPQDKQYTLLFLDLAGQGPRVPSADAQAIGCGYLGGAAVGDLVAAQQQATADTLAKRGRSVRVISMKTLDERAMGALFMHFMLETIIAADLLQVNPFDQPAVEEGKVLARKYLAERLTATT